ncbi:MAG: PIG-L family deacetylase [Acidobacteria bacterium]|nr:PIG-L family deacetylase [Acidobacteriota bacterium]
MKRRGFLGGAAAALGASQAQGQEHEIPSGGTRSTSYRMEVTVERARPGKPHKGKVLAAIQPHCDDIPIFAGGTVLKLLDEGYKGILITVSDDSMAGAGASYGDIIYKNEQDTMEVARRLGISDTFFLKYPNHNMDAWPIVEMRARLIFLFRLMKVDTVIVYDPAALYERNPDHYVIAKAVESAAWMAGSRWDYPEHFKAGLEPHAPQDKYYFARGPQLVNRVVDITPYMDRKVYANMANVTQGPAGNTGARLRQSLARQGKKLPVLGNDDETANRAYTKRFALHRDRIRGQAHGLEYAEYFHYDPPEESDIGDYVEKNAVPL